MNRIRLVPFLTAVSALVFSYPQIAHSACDLTLNANDVTVNWNLNYVTLGIQITLNKAQAEACSFGIGFSKGLHAATYANRQVKSGENSLPFQLYKEPGRINVLKDVPDITSANDVITGGFPAGTDLNQAILYYLDIPYITATTPTLVKAGNFTEQIIINVYEGANPLAFLTPVSTATINVTIKVPKLINMSLVATGGAFDGSQTSRSIDFGSFVTGQSNAFDLRVRTNAGFRVSFSSFSNGVMKPTAGGASAIPYRFYANGALLDLSNSAAVPVVGPVGPGATVMNGLAYPIQLIVGTVPALAQGGAYSDSITVTATTTE